MTDRGPITPRRHAAGRSDRPSGEDIDWNPNRRIGPVPVWQPGSPDAIYWLLTLSAGEHAVRARIAWAREALDLLDRNAADLARPVRK